MNEELIYTLNERLDALYELFDTAVIMQDYNDIEIIQERIEKLQKEIEKEMEKKNGN